ncbi:MAG: thioredoxin [Deltaproteobacteria bacterium]|nr:thioredoxin [Deltaproteobacteria bacterium]
MAQYVHDVSAADFQTKVVERSKEVPVLVDFWAAWCGPCRMLGPVLEKLAEDMAGKFELAKVDTEANQAIAMQFGIRGIPACKLFVGGEVVDEFVGALPEAAVRDFLDKAMPSAADGLVEEARALHGSGKLEGARSKLTAALAEDSGHTGARLLMARVAIASEDGDSAGEHLAAIPTLADQAEDAAYLRQLLDLMSECRAIGGVDACRRTLEANPDDLDARYALGACLAASGSYQQALDELIAVVGKDKRHRDEAARKAILTIFGVVGIRSELANSYRKKLSILL